MTGGSSTTYSEMDRYRQAGAAARMLLVTAAAKRWGVAEDTCRVENGWVVSGANRLSFGALADEAAALPAPSSVTLKDPSKWTLIGKDTRRLDTPEKISGKAVFGLDVKLPDLATAVVARSPVFGGTLKGFDDAAKAVPKSSRLRGSSGVAVVATISGPRRRAARVDRGLGEGAERGAQRPAAREYVALSRLRERPRGGRRRRRRASRGEKISATYTSRFAHAPMEPLNCTVKKTPAAAIWTGTQFQTDQGIAAKILGIEARTS